MEIQDIKNKIHAGIVPELDDVDGMMYSGHLSLIPRSRLP